MDLELSESQSLLVASARAFLAEHHPVDAGLGAAPGEQTARLWRAMAELGWPGLLVPEAHGGVGAGLLDAVLLAEAIGFAGCLCPFAHSAVAGTVILGALGSPDAPRLAALAAGERTLALALAEETGEPAAAAVRLEGGGGRPLRGAKRFVRDADLADELLVSARDPAGGGLVLLAVPARATALLPMGTLSGERLFEVRFEAVDPGDPLAAGAGAEHALARGLAAGALARAGEMAGLGQRILDLVTDYAKVRVQSGQPIGAFQAVQHRCADMLRDLEGARAITYRAAWGFDHAGAWATEAAIAKAYASEACLAVARRAHQVMGAIGYCEEHPLHWLHKRVHAAALDFGDAAAHLETIADALGGGALLAPDYPAGGRAATDPAGAPT